VAKVSVWPAASSFPTGWISFVGASILQFETRFVGEYDENLGGIDRAGQQGERCGNEMLEVHVLVS
jgi:hypothetical protein